jgi:hypothetical protein
MRRPEGPHTAVADLQPSSSQQPPQNNQDPQHEIEAGSDQHQDSEEEIEVVIEDEFTRLHQENEHLWLKQEHMAKRRAAMQ